MNYEFVRIWAEMVVVRFKVQSCHFPAETEETHEKAQDFLYSTDASDAKYLQKTNSVFYRHAGQLV
jgi:hypothetical protein